MNPEAKLFEQIREKVTIEETGVEAGKMMSSPAITYHGKVFAFLSKTGTMVFKFGKEFNPADQDFEATPFNPFKNKGPLAGWFEVPYAENQLWESLTKEALTLFKQTDIK